MRCDEAFGEEIEVTKGDCEDYVHGWRCAL
jgi:hypothetical protein